MKFARPPWLPIAEYVDMIDRGKLTEREAIRAGRSLIKQHPEFADGLIDQYVSAELRDQQRVTPKQPEPAPEPQDAAPVAVVSADAPPRRPAAPPPRKTDEQLVLELFPSLPYRVPVAVGARRPWTQLDRHGLDMMANMLVNQYTHAKNEGMAAATAKLAQKWDDKIADVENLRKVFAPLMREGETVADVITRVGHAKIAGLISRQ